MRLPIHGKFSLIQHLHSIAYPAHIFSICAQLRSTKRAMSQVNLVSSFQDSHRLYMVLEVVMGGELFTYLQVSTAPTSRLRKGMDAEGW